MEAHPVQAGDRLIFRTAGSGGWGDPLQRPSELVLRDVRRDLVSEESAGRDYGVVIADGQIDASATEQLRARLAAERGAPAQFDYGERPEALSLR